MQQETVEIRQYESGSATFSLLSVSLSKISSYQSCNAVIGYPGLPNIKKVLDVGDTVLYETTENGIIEIRVTATVGAVGSGVA